MRTCARRIGAPVSADMICPRMTVVPRGAPTRGGVARAWKLSARTTLDQKTRLGLTPIRAPPPLRRWPPIPP